MVKEPFRRLLPSPALSAARAARDAYRRIGYLRARWSGPLGTRPPIGLAVCAIFRDEDDFEGSRFVKSIVNPRTALGTRTRPANYFLFRGTPVAEDRRPVLQQMGSRAAPDQPLLRQVAGGVRTQGGGPAVSLGYAQPQRFPGPPGSVLDGTVLQFSAELRELLSNRGDGVGTG